jgi:hypothetical protein
MKTVGEPEEIHIPREDEPMPLVIPAEEPVAVPAEAPEREADPVPS